MVFEDVVGLPVTTVVTSPVMGVPVTQLICAWAPATGNRVASIAASATNRGVFIFPPPLNFCGGPKTPASVSLSVRPRSFAMTETDDLPDVCKLTFLVNLRMKWLNGYFVEQKVY